MSASSTIDVIEMHITAVIKTYTAVENFILNFIKSPEIILPHKKYFFNDLITARFFYLSKRFEIRAVYCIIK